MDTSSPVEELVEAKQELLEEIERLCERRDRIYGDCEVSGAVTTLRGELEGLQATRERLTGEIQAARAELLAGARAEHVPEIARLTAERTALAAETVAAQTELQELQDSLPALRCEVIEAQNSRTQAADQIAASKQEFETWRSEEMSALDRQRDTVAEGREGLVAERGAIQNGRAELAVREARFEECERLRDERAQQLKSEQDAIAAEREHCGAIKIANDKRADEIYDKERAVTDREWALSDREQARTDRSDTLDTREAAIKQREADLIENWAVLEEHRGQNAAG